MELQHNPLLQSKIWGEFWKSQISQWLAYLSGYSHGDWGTEGSMSGAYVMSIGCMQTCLGIEYQWSVMKKIMKWHSWPKIWWNWTKKVQGDLHFRQSRPGLALLVLQRNRRTGSRREEFCRWVSNKSKSADTRELSVVLFHLPLLLIVLLNCWNLKESIMK